MWLSSEQHQYKGRKRKFAFKTMSKYKKKNSTFKGSKNYDYHMNEMEMTVIHK